MSEIEYYDAVGPYIEKYLVDGKFGEMESMIYLNYIGILIRNIMIYI